MDVYVCAHTYTVHICFIVGISLCLLKKFLAPHMSRKCFSIFLLNPYSLNLAFISTIYLELILVLDVNRGQNPFFPYDT